MQQHASQTDWKKISSILFNEKTHRFLGPIAALLSSLPFPTTCNWLDATLSRAQPIHHQWVQSISIVTRSISCFSRDLMYIRQNSLLSGQCHQYVLVKTCDYLWFDLWCFGLTFRALGSISGPYNQLMEKPRFDWGLQQNPTVILWLRTREIELKYCLLLIMLFRQFIILWRNIGWNIGPQKFVQDLLCQLIRDKLNLFLLAEIGLISQESPEKEYIAEV